MFPRKAMRKTGQEQQANKFNPSLSLYAVRATVQSQEFKAEVEAYMTKTGKTQEELTSAEILTLYSQFLAK